MIDFHIYPRFLLFVVFAFSGFYAKVSGETQGLASSTTVEFLQGKITFRTSEDGTSPLIRKGSFLPDRSRVFCHNGARLVLRNDFRSLRFMEAATFVSMADSLSLWSGACLLDQRDKRVLKANPFLISAPEVEIECIGRGSLIVEVQTSGGIKLIGLTGHFKLRLSDNDKFSTELRPGDLRFVKPYGRGFGDLVHLNLETLVSTAALIHEFPKDTSLEAELAKVTLEQVPLVKKRYRARVGDSRTPETFELRSIPSKDKKY